MVVAASISQVTATTVGTVGTLATWTTMRCAAMASAVTSAQQVRAYYTVHACLLYIARQRDLLQCYGQGIKLGALRIHKCGCFQTPKMFACNAAGLKNCAEGQCMDVNKDSLHCGGCNLPCDVDNGAFCEAGTCACPTGMHARLCKQDIWADGAGLHYPLSNFVKCIGVHQKCLPFPLQARHPAVAHVWTLPRI